MSKTDASWKVKELSTGITAAAGSAPTVEQAAREAGRYAMQYAKDGPVQWWVKEGRKTVISGSLAGPRGRAAISQRADSAAPKPGDGTPKA